MDNNLNNISSKNRIRVADILEIIVDELELQTLNRIKGNDIPWNYFQRLGYLPNTVQVFLKFLKNEYKAKFIIWNCEKEWLRLYVEPIYNQVYKEGAIQGWTNDQIEAEINKKSYEAIVRRVKENLVIGISKEQLINLKEILAVLKAKIPIKKGQEESDKDRLFEELPKNGKYKEARKIAKQLLTNRKVDNWILARCITPTLRHGANKRRKFGRNDYRNDKESYNSQIQNRLDTINKKWEGLNYCAKFHADFCELTTLK